MKSWMTVLSALVMLWSVADVRAAEKEKTVVEPTSVTKIVADGRHNAFTALRHWKGQFWLAFRKADGHGYGEADVHVLRSADGQKWEETYRVNALPDDRDPQFLATKDRLFLYTPSLKGSVLTSFVSYTDDGKKWTKPVPVYQPRYIFWKPLERGGKFYASAHLKSRDGKERDVHLITSDDGLDLPRWQAAALLPVDNPTAIVPIPKPCKWAMRCWSATTRLTKGRPTSTWHGFRC